MARNPRPGPAPEPIETIMGTAGNDYLVAMLGTSARYFGGAGDDYLKGWIRADVLEGGDGNDQLFDGDGTDGISGAADTLRGGAGNDRLYSNFGADILDGGAGIDYAQVNLYSSNAAVTSSGASGSGATLTLSNGARIIDVESLTLLLGGGSDTITTGNSLDTIYAGGGNDVIRTLGGDDTLSGEAGNDVLDGGAGDDFLIGGAGLDTLIGGAGADRFVLDQTANGLDRILDFSIAGGDKLYGSFFEVIDDETNRIINDPIGAGLVRVSDTAQGALVEVLVAGSFASSALLVGVTAAELIPTFTII